jgi:hypothetical protein
MAAVVGSSVMAGTPAQQWFAGSIPELLSVRPAQE